MSRQIALLKRLYRFFNLKKVDAILPMLHPEVTWANGMEGGYLTGREAVRDYWMKQWRLVDPKVIPISFMSMDAKSTKVDVHQTVTDLQGKLLMDRNIVHTFWIEDGLIRRFEIG